MGKIKLLLTINNLKTSGMKYVLADIALGLPNDEFDVTIGVKNFSNSELEKSIKNKIKLIELPIRSKYPKKSFYYWWEIFEFGRRHSGKFDLVHAFDWSSDPFEVLGWYLSSTPCIVEKTNLSYSFLKWFLKISAAKRVVCLSEAQVEQLAFFKKKIVKVPTGIDVLKFNQVVPHDRTDFGLSPEHKILISVAHLVPVKGHQEILFALHRIKDLIPDLRVLFVGAGDPAYENKLKGLVGELELNEYVLFLGERNDVPSLLKMADGKILATRNEGRREAFGAAIVEAMAAGLPVIATRSGGPEEIVNHGETGWLIDGTGIEPLEKGIMEFYNTPRKKLLQMGSEGAKIAKSYYSKENMIYQYACIYKEVLGKGK